MQIQARLIADTLANTFIDLEFNEENHTYTVDKGASYLPSVSALIKKHVPYVDFKILAQRQADKKGIPVEVIQHEWKMKAENAANRGTAAHKFAEDYPNVELPSNPLEHQIVNFFKELPEHIVIVSKELRMHHRKYKYAGTSDLILLNTNTGKLIIADFKTNEDLYKFPFSNLLPPFDFLPTNDANKYQIQLNYYQIMLEQAGFEVEDRLIVWIKNDEYKKIFCSDFTKELKQCLDKNLIQCLS